MALCVQNVNGQLVPTADPASSCTGYLLVTRDEWTLSHLLPPMSVSDGAMVGGSILLAWATAFVFRAAARTLYQRNEE
ncbi:phage coat protein [Cupriavidus plantarum]|uniref:phage coat protein n=1 Tax=Cupriavidus plantarum TaxID=942865 RepID=UPI0015C9AC85|nr:phage coat protein [Cupriavidus plantarum]NYI00231.1 hypothetical protein [Cupriavidus plantarum]